MPMPNFVAHRTTKRVAQRMTQPARPDAEYNRYYAWQHMAAPQTAPQEWAGELSNVPGVYAPTGRLKEIAEKYDEATRLLELDATEDLDETDLLAGLLIIRALREKLIEDERRFIAAARQRKITWARLADALEVGSRQAAERRYLQLRTDLDEISGDSLTQHERVEYARDQRDRLAERAWAVEHADEIRTVAADLLALADLQRRADGSPRAHKAHSAAKRDAEQEGLPLPVPTPARWPIRLREAFDHCAALVARASRQGASDLGTRLPKSGGVAHAIHQMSGLVANAADPDIVDLTDHPALAARITALYGQPDPPLALRPGDA
jgi:hypothetical protein